LLLSITNDSIHVSLNASSLFLVKTSFLLLGLLSAAVGVIVSVCTLAEVLAGTVVGALLACLVLTSLTLSILLLLVLALTALRLVAVVVVAVASLVVIALLVLVLVVVIVLGVTLVTLVVVAADALGVASLFVFSVGLALLAAVWDSSGVSGAGSFLGTSLGASLASGALRVLLALSLLVVAALGVVARLAFGLAGSWVLSVLASVFALLRLLLLSEDDERLLGGVSLGLVLGASAAFLTFRVLVAVVLSLAVVSEVFLASLLAFLLRELLLSSFLVLLVLGVAVVLSVVLFTGLLLALLVLSVGEESLASVAAVLSVLLRHLTLLLLLTVTLLLRAVGGGGNSHQGEEDDNGSLHFFEAFLFLSFFGEFSDESDAVVQQPDE
jgi:hypothetical protein